MPTTLHSLMPSVTSAPAAAPRIVVLSSSLLTERMLLYSSFLPAIQQRAALHLWTTSPRNLNYKDQAGLTEIEVEHFPEVLPFKEFPYNYLRRLNEWTWDYRLQAPSRLSMRRHVRDKQMRWHIRNLKYPARMLASLGLENAFESWLEGVLLNYPRSPEGAARLGQLRPAALLTMGTFRYEEPAIAAAAKTLGIPVLAFITSWDNPTTKNRMVFKYDGYVVWSEEMKAHLHTFYPHSQSVPVYVVGAPQFDVFFQSRFEQSRAEFCAEQQLDPALPILLYALSSPNFIPEFTAVRHLAEQVASGALGRVQLLVRPHPLFDKGQIFDELRRLGPRVIVQDTGQRELNLQQRAQNESHIRQWVNTFRHAAVVVNLSSTAAIDGALFDKPVVNLDFDPEPEQLRQGLVKDLNHLWTHFKPIAESGGLWLVNNLNEMITATKTYLEQPGLHRERRRWMADFVTGYADGQSGARFAEALIDFVGHQNGADAKRPPTTN